MIIVIIQLHSLILVALRFIQLVELEFIQFVPLIFHLQLRFLLLECDLLYLNLVVVKLVHELLIHHARHLLGFQRQRLTIITIRFKL